MITHQSRTRQSGFTLLEVLVAAVLMSIGLLGLAAMQLSSLKSNHNAYMSTLASNLLNDGAERLRSNEQRCDCLKDDNCTSANFTSCIPTAWQADVVSELPDAEATMCLDNTPNDGTGTASAACSGTGNIVAIKIWWNDTRDPNATNRRLTLPVMPR